MNPSRSHTLLGARAAWIVALSLGCSSNASDGAVAEAAGGSGGTTAAAGGTSGMANTGGTDTAGMASTSIAGAVSTGSAGVETGGGGAGGAPAIAGGTGGDATGSGGSGGDPGAGGSGGTAAVVDPGPFVCSEMIGLWVMSQWYGPFENGVDSDIWQYTFVHHGYLETWADPTSDYWNTNVNSACAMNSTDPDRVIFLPFSLTMNSLEQWHTNLASVVDVIQTKFPHVKRIELISTIRTPGNQPCPNDNDPGIVIEPQMDQAMQDIADQSGGLVIVGPKIEVADCSWWAGGTDLTGEGNTGVGQLYADWYKDN